MQKELNVFVYLKQAVANPVIHVLSAFSKSLYKVLVSWCQCNIYTGMYGICIALVTNVVVFSKLGQSNKSGPRMDPWGTPNLISVSSDVKLPVHTEYFLFSKYVLNHYINQ